MSVDKPVGAVGNIAIIRSPEQMTAALKYANEVRSLRATLKRNLKDGSASIYKLLDDPAKEFATMKVRVVLMALPHWGPEKALRAMLFCRIAHNKTLGGLSLRQRGEIAAYLTKVGVK